MDKSQLLRSWYFWVSLAAVVGTALFFVLLDSDIVKSLFDVAAVLDNAEALREKILATGSWAPLLFIALQIMQVLLSPLPGEATGLLGGYLFGVWEGFFLSTIGLAIGSWIAFAIGHFCGDLIGDRLRRTKTYARFNHLAVKNDFVIPFVLYLLPGFPKDILGYFLGLSRMPAPVFMFISAIGRIPGTMLLSVQGARVYERDFGQLALLLLLTLAICLPCYLFRGRFLHRYEDES